MFRFTRNGTRREMGLGPLESVPLAKARTLAGNARGELVDGLDPIQQRRERERVVPLFRDAAQQYFVSHRAAWSNPKHAQQWLTTLITYAHPVIGDLAVDQIETNHIMRVLDPIWREKPETATRVRGRLERVLDWCAVQGFRSTENPARWRGHLEALLPPRSKVRAVQHHRALPWQDVPEFMVQLRERTGVAARALELAILTAARSGEVRGATWEEIDLESRTWTVPADRMKVKREHRVPLSGEAVELLKSLPWCHSSPRVFPSPQSGKALSDAALGKVLKDMNIPVTAHGFRASFRDWCAESLSPRGCRAGFGACHLEPRRGSLQTRRPA